jgi:hypothetical protein
MMYRSLAIVALTLASSGPALAQSIYLYVAPGASVYVGAPTNDVYGAPPVAYVPGGAVYGAPGPVIAAPLTAPPDIYAPPPVAYVAPAPAYTPAPAYAPPPGYDAPLRAYGAATGAYAPRRAYVRERAYLAPRPPAPVPYRWRGW